MASLTTLISPALCFRPKVVKADSQPNVSSSCLLSWEAPPITHLDDLLQDFPAGEAAVPVSELPVSETPDR